MRSWHLEIFVGTFDPKKYITLTLLGSLFRIKGLLCKDSKWIKKTTSAHLDSICFLQSPSHKEKTSSWKAENPLCSVSAPTMVLAQTRQAILFFFKQMNKNQSFWSLKKVADIHRSLGPMSKILISQVKTEKIQICPSWILNAFVYAWGFQDRKEAWKKPQRKQWDKATRQQE